MGWTYARREPNVKDFDWFAQEFNYNDDKQRNTVLAAARVGSTVYLAQEIENKLTNTKMVLALVVLTERGKPGAYNFGYKEMGEACEPFFYDCPKRIFDMLTPLPDDPAFKGAHTWREKVQQKLAE
jgi:hypothetical protein